MPHVVRSGQWTATGKVAFSTEGDEHGAAVSLILEDMPAGGGPRLHTHPYPECWVVIAGRGRFTAGDLEIEAAAGDIVYVEAGMAHKFVAKGDEPLRMVCIHQSGRFETAWLEPERG